MAINGGRPIRIQKYFAVKTFESEGNKYIDAAINYYEQRYNSFQKTMIEKLLQRKKELYTTESIPDYLEKRMNELNTLINNFIEDFSTIQNLPTGNIQQNLQQINILTNGLQQKEMKLNDLLALFNPNLSTTAKTFGVSVGAKDLKPDVQRLINAKTPKSAGGARSRLLGEVFERGVAALLQKCLGDIFNVDQTGGKKSLIDIGNNRRGERNNALGQIKSDILMYTGLNYANTSINPNNLIMSYLYNNNRQNFQVLRDSVTNRPFLLDAFQPVDLNNTAQINNLYAPPNQIAGVNIKSWFRTTGGTLGNYAISAKEINTRAGRHNGKRIALKMLPHHFNLYNAYIVSKYLVNIIGVYNIYMITGDTKLMPIHKWLRDIYDTNEQNKVIRHVGEGTRSVKAAIKNNKGTKGNSTGGYFRVSNRLIIAKS